MGRGQTILKYNKKFGFRQIDISKYLKNPKFSN